MTWHSRPEHPSVTPGENSQQTRVDEAISCLSDHVGDDVGFLWTGGKEAQVIADMLLYAIGDLGETPVSFLTIDTGNAYDEMYKFRSEYTSATGDKGADTVGPANGVSGHRLYRHGKMLESVIRKDTDPRGYHGRLSDPTCPACGVDIVDWDREGYTIQCSACSNKYTIEDKYASPAEWDVPSSCGVLKTVPMREIIEDYGFSKLITGRRSTDPVTPGGSNTELAHVRERSKPSPHTRVNPLANWSESNVYAYIAAESVKLPDLYTEQGYRHTDSQCCTDDDAVGEYGEGGRDPQKQGARERLEDMGYV